MFDGIVKNLKFLGADGQILTAGKSGKIPPGQINGTGGNVTEAFRYFYHPDHLGSTSYITDASGEVYQHVEYFAFGETFVEEHSNTERTPYLFNGKELDEETGLYYYGARYYDGRTSVWQSVDALADKYPSLSPFAYVANNPIIYIDPDGKRIILSGTAAFQKATLAALQKVTNDKLSMRKDGTIIVVSVGTENKGRSLKYGTALIRSLNGKGSKDHTHTIIETKGGNSTTPSSGKDATNGKGTDSTIEYNPTKTTGGVDVSGSYTRPPEIGLAHEAIHAGHMNKGTVDNTKEITKTDPDTGKVGKLTKEETQTRKEENIIRKEQGQKDRATPK